MPQGLRHGAPRCMPATAFGQSFRIGQCLAQWQGQFIESAAGAITRGARQAHQIFRRQTKGKQLFARLGVIPAAIGGGRKHDDIARPGIACRIEAAADGQRWLAKRQQVMRIAMRVTGAAMPCEIGKGRARSMQLPGPVRPAGLHRFLARDMRFRPHRPCDATGRPGWRMVDRQAGQPGRRKATRLDWRANFAICAPVWFARHPSETVAGGDWPRLNSQPRRGKEISGGARMLRHSTRFRVLLPHQRTLRRGIRLVVI